MAPSSTPRDPRSVVTPDAFELSTELLGLRLAPPGRRLAALVIDLVVIGIITLITGSFALILGVLVAVLLIRAGFKRTPVRASVFDRAMRASVGCLGVLVAIVTAALWAAFGIGGASDSGVSVRTEPELGSAFDRMPPLRTTPGAAEPIELVQEVAADTLAALGARIEALEDEVDDLEEDLSGAEAALEAAAGGTGLFGSLLDLVDELGFGFGWASLYMTVMLSWWKGQTLGKRLLGIRVLRLDGGPITWWVAFERAGGYAAGFATGLLGFAQVFWDANRQAIHDRIVGTVVVLDGAPKALDWESAL
ncbi:MAG TPA: RDD family protein [Longimicrobiales bacterium]|nr:RDD family protein [Longimicrobiales bacterium]